MTVHIPKISFDKDEVIIENQKCECGGTLLRVQHKHDVFGCKCKNVYSTSHGGKCPTCSGPLVYGIYTQVEYECDKCGKSYESIESTFKPHDGSKDFASIFYEECECGGTITNKTEGQKGQYCPTCLKLYTVSNNDKCPDCGKNMIFCNIIEITAKCDSCELSKYDTNILI